MDVRKAPRRLAWWHPVIDAIAPVVVISLVVAMLIQWFSVYFTIQPPADPPTPAQVTGYCITATIAIVYTLAGFIASLLRRSVAGIVGYLALGALVASAVLLFSVPQTDWVQLMHDLRTPDYPVNPNYCSRTDSENCPGG